MSYLMRKLRQHFIAKSQETVLLRVKRALEETFAHLEAEEVAAKLRVAKYDGMGRLTHTQELLRGQAEATAKAYAKVTTPAFREGLAKSIIEEILR